MAQPVVEKSLGVGIDAFHPEDKIPQGGAVDLVNAIARSTDSITKRPGWRLAAGYLPVRVTRYVEASAAGGTITLTLPSTFSLANLVSTPVIISGRTTQSGAALGRTVASIYASGFTFSAGSHTITIVHSGAGDYTETSPEVDIYGLLASAGTPPTGLTADLASSDANWIPNLLTQYESPAVAGLVCIRGGVPYITTSPTADTTLYPAAVSSPAIGLSAGAVIGPALYASTPSPAPDRGYIVSSAVTSGNLAPVYTATYNSGPGTTTYTLAVTAYTASASLASIIRAGVDSLTVSGASWAALNGEFPVVSVTAVDADHIAVEVTNAANAAVEQQRSDSAMSALAGILTDSLPAVSPVPVPAGAVLTFSDATLAAKDLYAYASTSNCVVGPLTESYSVASGVTISSTRTGSVVPLTSLASLLRGDELVCSADGLLRCILGVNPNGNQSASITVSAGSGGGANTAVATVGTTAGLRAGVSVLVAAASVPFGEVLVSAITGTTLTFSTTVAPGTYSAELIGNTVSLETPVALGLSTTYGINRRWVAIPCAYDPSLGVQPQTPIANKPFPTPTDLGVTDTDYSPHFSAAQVSRSLYVTDGLNPVKKFDGVQMTNAGLPNLAPALMLLKQESPGGIANPNQSVQVNTGVTTYSVSVPAGTAGNFQAGEQVCVRNNTLGQLVGGATASDFCFLADSGDAATGLYGVNLVTGAAVQLFAGASGSLPTGLFAGVTYYVWPNGLDGVNPQYKLYTSLADALAGNANYVTPGALTTNVIACGDVGDIVFPTASTHPTLNRVLYTTVTSADTTNNTVTVADPLTSVLPTAAGTPTLYTLLTSSVPLGSIVQTVAVKYYVKLRLVDRNGNVTLTAGVGAEDFYLQLGVPTAIRGLLLNFPALPDVQLARVEWEFYRTGGDRASPPYYLVASNSFDFTTSPHPIYVSFTDTVQPSQLADASGAGLGQTDPNSTLTSGASSGPLFDRPPLAKYATSISGRLVLANYRSPHRMTVAFRKKGGQPILPTANFAPAFILKQGTSAPVSVGTSTGQITCAFVPATAQSVRSQLWQSSNSEVSGNWGWNSGDYLYAFDNNQRQDLVGSDLYGWWIADSAGTFPVGGTEWTATYSSGTGLWTVTAGSIAGLPNGSPVYLQHGDTVGLATQTTFYIGVNTATTFYLYATQIDALAAITANRVAAASATATAFSAGDASAYPGLVTSGGILRPSQDTFPVVLDQMLAAANNGLSTQQTQEVGWNAGGGHAASATSSIEQQMANRLAAAINAAQAVYAAHTPAAQPFVYARAGNDVGYATIVIEAINPTQQFNFTYIPETQDGLFDVYVDGVLYVPDAGLTGISGTTQSTQKLFPSRLSISFPNYPETHDNPYTTTATVPGAYAPSDSLTVMDLNPDDGQEITGIYPFFGPSFSTAAQQNQYILVAKGRDVYLVDPVQRTANLISSAGHGCEFPRTMAEAYSSIGFVDHTGIQCVRGNATGTGTVWTYYGQMMERFWRESAAASLDHADVPVAKQSRYHNLWRLAIPTTNPTYNDGVLVYDYTREQASVAYGQLPGQGGWSRFTNMQVVAWATFNAADYYAAGDSGQVMMERRDGLPTDYRDYPQQAIAEDVILRPVDCDLPGVRKRATSIVISFRSEVETKGTTVWTSIDSDGVWKQCDNFELVRPLQDTNLSDRVPYTVQSIRFTPPYTKWQQIQVRIMNSTIDEPLEITSVAFDVDVLTPHGIPQAASTISNGG